MINTKITTKTKFTGELINLKHIEFCKADNIVTLERCLEIRNTVFCVEKGVPREIEVDEHDCLSEICNHFLIRYEENDAGAIRCLYTSSDTIRIQRLCFLKEYRGLGLGKALIEYIEAYYRNRGITKITLDSKYEVSGFYEKCGYKKISDVFIEANVEHIKMMKEI